MRINDMFVSQISDRVVSVSSDQTCKVYWRLIIYFLKLFCDQCRHLLKDMELCQWELGADTKPAVSSRAYQLHIWSLGNESLCWTRQRRYSRNLNQNNCNLPHFTPGSVLEFYYITLFVFKQLHDTDKLMNDAMDNKSFLGHE